jgi:hypothetical protein
MFVKVVNGQIDQYPYTVGDLRRDNPNTSFPKQIPEAAMASYGMFPVGYEAAPDYDPMTHRLQHSSQPVQVDGKWLLTKTVVALTPEQVADRDAAKGAEVRKQRDKLIADSDWMALSDNTLTADWATYRQALRDVTNHVNFPYLTDADWPVEPA